MLSFSIIPKKKIGRFYIILQLEKVQLTCRVNLTLSMEYFHSLIFKYGTKTLTSPSEVTSVSYSVHPSHQRKELQVTGKRLFFQ